MSDYNEHQQDQYHYEYSKELHELQCELTALRKELDEAREAILISKHWCVVPECQCPLCLFLAKYPDRATGAKESV